MKKKKIVLLLGIILVTTIQAQDTDSSGFLDKELNVTTIEIKDLDTDTDSNTITEIVDESDLLLVEEDKKEEDNKKKWSLDMGASYKDRQQGRINAHGYEVGMPDDAEEGGDLSTVFTKLKYQVTDKWALEYDYGYLYSTNQEAEGYGVDKDGNKTTKDNGFQISNTIWLKRSFDQFSFLNKEWNPRAAVGYRNYSQSAYNDADTNELLNGGYDSNRVLFNTGLSSQLTKKDNIDISYEYQYRDYDYNDDTDSYQHRNYFTVDYGHKINDNWNFDLSNTLYIKLYSGSGNGGHNYGEWDYNATVNYNKEITKNITYSPYIIAWGELSLWENGSGKGAQNYNQSEINFYPIMFKYTAQIKDVEVSPYVGAGYTQGYDTQGFDTMYAGFEGLVGISLNTKF